MRSYYQMCKPIAERVIELYKNDFYVHDKEQLSGIDNLKRTFIWLVRPTGTHLIELIDSEWNIRSDYIGLLRLLKGVFHSFGNNIESYLLKDAEIVKMENDKAEEMVVRWLSEGKEYRLYG